MDVTIYHNPRCSKSRATLELIRARGVEPKVVEYLDSPPSVAELKEILRMLGIGARELARPKEVAWSDNGLDDPAVVDDEVIAQMVAHPILIERPIVVCGGRAIIGRPPENVNQLLA